MPRPTATSASHPFEPPPPALGVAWDELALVLDDLARQAREEPDEDRFCRGLLAACVTALSAESGAVWAAQADGRLRRRTSTAPAAQTGESGFESAEQTAREQLLRQALVERTTQTLATDSGVVVAAPIVVDPRSAPTSLIEITLRPGAAPSAYQAARRFLEAACEIAAERALRTDLRRLRGERDQQRRLADLGRVVQSGGDLRRTAYRIANETRPLVGCDRVSVLTVHENRPRLVAVSGAERVDRRSQSARGLEELARIACRFDEPLCLLDGDQSIDGAAAEGPAADALHRYADQSHARQLVALPMHGQADEDSQERPVVGVLVAEQFDAASGALAKELLAEAADAVAPALATAVALDGLPLLGLSKSLRAWMLPRGVRRTAMVAAAAVVAVLVLMLTPARFTVESPGKLQPATQQQVFAPGDGLVEAIHVEHGQKVEAGALLVELRDPQLDLQLKQIDGELATTRRQLDAARAMRTGLDSRSRQPEDAYRLSSEAQRLQVRIDSLSDERELLRSQRESLRITSPAAGTIITWRVEESLVGRPVQRGQVLLSVADTEGDWQVELQTPDDRIGHVLAAHDAGDEPLRAEYRLASEERGYATGLVTRIAQRAEPNDSAKNDRSSVLVVVTPDDPRHPAADPLGVRPGQSVRARIDCGRRSLGYVWLHDVWHTLRTWWEF